MEMTAALRQMQHGLELWKYSLGKVIKVKYVSFL